MTDAIFLSAGIPDSKRSPEYAKTADSVAIAAAVSSLVYVTLGRRILVWGGQPAITPMIWAIAEDLQTDYGSWVKLYQSNHFRDRYPEDNQRFHNVIYTDDIGHNREESLRVMRERMFSDFNFTAAVFIGGMSGIVREFDLFRRMQPRALLIPVISTGGAVLDVARRMEIVPNDLRDDMDYVGLFHRYLDISVKERRYRNPTDQPPLVAHRLWQGPDAGSAIA
jgi:hypothetical protein